MQTILRDATAGDCDAILRINCDALPGVAELTPAYFEHLMSVRALFRLIEVKERVVGYLCTMNPSAAYDREEFQWFRERLRENFLYIDQVALALPYRGHGLGRTLYDDLEPYTYCNGIDTLVCEVNYKPANVASLAFHQQRGFSGVGRMNTRGVIVSLLAKRKLSAMSQG
jgi:predicted GNAT superfamily acetyltransferase